MLTFPLPYLPSNFLAKSFCFSLSFINPSNNSFFLIPKFSKEDLHIEKIHPSWDLILLDNTIPNKPFRANGAFCEKHASSLENILKDTSNIIIGNHFPLDDEKQSHKLLGSDNLKKILKEHNSMTLYLHGHTHKTSYHKEDDKFHIFNSSEVTVNHKFKYHHIDLDGDNFSHKEIQYFE